MRTTTIAFVIGLALTGCRGSSEPATTVSTVTTLATPTTVAPTKPTTTTVAPVHPLTGLPGRPLEDQTLIVKVDNAPKARPSVGLGSADVIIEVLVEGGIPRFLAVFQSLIPPEIGPVRSTREVDPKLIEPFDSRFAFSGGDPSVQTSLLEVAVLESHDLLGDESYTRDPKRPATYNLILETSKLPDRAFRGPAPAPITFFDQNSTGAEPAKQIKIDASSRDQVGFEFREDAYFRLQDGAPLLDVEGNQLKADSVVVLFVKQLTTGRKDASGAPVPDYEVTGKGDAILFRQGTAVKGGWIRDNQSEFFRLENQTGKAIGPPPGRTWYLVVPIGRQATWS